MADFIIVAVASALVVFNVYSYFKRRKTCGSCAACPYSCKGSGYCDIDKKKKEDKKDES